MPYKGEVTPSPNTLRHSQTVTPVKVRFWSDHFKSDVSRVVGYQFHCTCGDFGYQTDTYAESRSLSIAHNIAAHR